MIFIIIGLLKLNFNCKNYFELTKKKSFRIEPRPLARQARQLPTVYLYADRLLVYKLHSKV